MKKNILVRTNLLVCIVIIIGFLITAVLGYRANISASLEKIEQISALSGEGIYHHIGTALTKPLNVSQTMASDSLLHTLLIEEGEKGDDPNYQKILKTYLNTYQNKYGYDSVFLVSAASSRYYNFNGLDRVLDASSPENEWYFDTLLKSDAEYTMNVDNDEVVGADNAITVFVNCKIRDNDGSLLGVVGVGVRIDTLQQTLLEYQEQFGVNAYLIDNTGMIQVAVDHSGYEGINLFDLKKADGEDIRQEILQWQEEASTLSFWALNENGQKQDYMVVRYLPEIHWYLVVEQDSAALLHALTRQFLFTAATIVAILICILLIITKVIRRFNKQIEELTRTIEAERQSTFEKATEQLFENIYDVDITQDRPSNQATKDYFESLGASGDGSYSHALHIISENQIKEESRQGYLDTFLPKNVRRAYEAGTESLLYELQMARDGENYYWMRITGQIVKLEADNHLHLLIYRQNIDEEKRREQEMRERAQTDEMTGFLTKTATQKHIEQMMYAHPEKSFAYFIFDIDNFKQINDKFGHAFGDAVICDFAETLRKNFRAGDVLGRIGGDEFAVFVPCPDEAWAERKALLLHQALYRNDSRKGKDFLVSASIGIAIAPQHGKDFLTLYKNADAALYETKKKGKDGFTVFGNTPHSYQD